MSITSPALERYLRRATAGLPPAKRQEVWDELEEHIYCRAEQLEWQGAAPEQALAQALSELGPPLWVSAGMNGVHNMPKMIAFSAVGILFAGASFYAVAQQPKTTLELPLYTPQQTSVCPTPPQPSSLLFVPKASYDAYLKVTGRSYRVEQNVLTLNSPHAGDTEGGSTSICGSTNAFFVPFPFLLMDAMVGQTKGAQLSGGMSPELSIGETAIRLAGEGDSTAQSVYDTVMRFGILQLFQQPSGGLDPDPYRKSVKLQTVHLPALKGEVVAAVYPSYLPTRLYSYRFGIVGEDGNLTIELPESDVTFVRLTHTDLNHLRSGLVVPE